MKIFGLAGWSGSGKTTLLTRLLPEITGRSFSVSTIKHAHHDFDPDQPGKDSFRHRAAGAREVMITAAHRWALIHELRGDPEPVVEEIVERMSPVDLLIIEGFKRDSHPKLEVHRPALGKSLLCRRDPHIVAVASDERLADVAVPVIGLDDIPAIADFILRDLGLELRKSAVAALRRGIPGPGKIAARPGDILADGRPEPGCRPAMRMAACCAESRAARPRQASAPVLSGNARGRTAPRASG